MTDKINWDRFVWDDADVLILPPAPTPVRASSTSVWRSMWIEEFYNKCHDKDGHFCAGEAAGLIPKDEQPVIAGAAESLKDKLYGLLHGRRQSEPGITSFLKYVARTNNGQVIGLDFKFKKAKGILDKVERKMSDKGISAEEALSGISDSLRYTLSFEPKGYADGVKNAFAKMKEKGFEFVDFEDNWQKGDAYNGINSTFRDKNGLVVELQFHTPESFRIKDTVIHKDYETYRSPKSSPAEKKAAFDRMVKASDGIEFPPGIEELCPDIPGCKSVFRPHKG